MKKELINHIEDLKISISKNILNIKQLYRRMEEENKKVDFRTKQYMLNLKSQISRKENQIKKLETFKNIFILFYNKKIPIKWTISTVNYIIKKFHNKGLSKSFIISNFSKILNFDKKNNIKIYKKNIELIDKNI